MEVISEERAERYRRVLGLDPAAGVDDVRRCYRREMRRWHPDVVGGDVERAKLINEARDYFTKHPAAIPVKPAAKARTPQPRAPQPPRRTPPTAPTPTDHRSNGGTAQPTPQPVEVPRASSPVSSRPRQSPVAVMAQPQALGWRLVGGAIQVVRFVVIAYLFLIAVGIVWWFLDAGLPWFLKVVVPMAGWG